MILWRKYSCKTHYFMKLLHAEVVLNLHSKLLGISENMHFILKGIEGETGSAKHFFFSKQIMRILALAIVETGSAKCNALKFSCEYEELKLGEWHQHEANMKRTNNKVVEDIICS